MEYLLENILIYKCHICVDKYNVGRQIAIVWENLMKLKKSWVIEMQNGAAAANQMWAVRSNKSSQIFINGASYDHLWCGGEH